MNRQTTIIISIQAFLIVFLFWVLVFYGKDEYEAYVQGEIEEEIETPNRISSSEGITIVTLPAAAQTQSGITLHTLESARHTGNLSTFGSVVSLDRLIESRNRYLTAQADASISRAALSNAQQEFDRLAALNRDNKNISDRVLASAEATLKAEQARVNAANSISRNIRDSIVQQWGETLAAQATQPGSNAAFERLLGYQDVLIQVTMPFDAPPPKSGDRLFLSPTGSVSSSSNSHIEAEFVSASPQTDAGIQGKTYFYRAPADTLRSGMRVNIKMQASSDSNQGVIIPSRAVVWYGGLAWAYLKGENDTFTRLPVMMDHETDGGWFTSSGFKAGDEVVITGAQLLLSEEFKYQITNENDD